MYRDNSGILAKVILLVTQVWQKGLARIVRGML